MIVTLSIVTWLLEGGFGPSEKHQFSGTLTEEISAENNEKCVLRSNGQKGPLLTTTRWCRPLLTIGRGEELAATNQWSSCGQTYSYLALVLALHLSLLPHVLFLQSYKKHMLVETDTFSFHAGHGWVTKNPSNCFYGGGKRNEKPKNDIFITNSCNATL